MRRGLFTLTLFIWIATTTVSLYAIHQQLLSEELQKQSEYLTALELFYTARNFEYDFESSVHSLQTLESWTSRWPGTVYGCFSTVTKTCIQTDDSLSEFVSKIMRFENGTAILESCGTSPSCFALPLEKGGFKTWGALISST